MDKEQEICTMFAYLAKKSTDVYSLDGKVFRLDRAYGIDSRGVPTRESYSFTVDFNNKTIDVYCYNESHHNGDHYDCVNTTLPWNCLDSSHERLKLCLRPYLKRDILDEINNKLIDQKLSELLKD